MSHMTQNASSATARCRRFTAFLTSSLKVKGFTQQINSYTQPVDNLVQNITTRSGHAQVIHMLDMAGTLTARALRGSERAASRIARSVAFVIGISLSIPMAVADGGSIDAIQTLDELADYQLTDKQYDCHNEIVFRESSNNRFAVNGSHHGYYQGRSAYLKGKPDDVQFYWYWKYVSHRYGITQYDEPDYCKALDHLVRYSWQ